MCMLANSNRIELRSVEAFISFYMGAVKISCSQSLDQIGVVTSLRKVLVDYITSFGPRKPVHKFLRNFLCVLAE